MSYSICNFNYQFILAALLLLVFTLIVDVSLLIEYMYSVFNINVNIEFYLFKIIANVMLVMDYILITLFMLIGLGFSFNKPNINTKKSKL